MHDGYEALRGGAAWVDLSSRGPCWAAGRDRARLLHNLTTNNVKALSPGEGCYAFVLNPQGRIQCDVHLFCLPDRVLLDTEPETRERLPQFLRKYIIADDVKLEDASGELQAVGVEGPSAAAVLASAGAPAPQQPWSHAPWEGGLVAAVSASGQPGFRIFVPPAARERLIAALETAGARRASADALRAVRVENGIPRFGEDIFDTTLPQETRQMHAVSFTKGCYLGQEIVERIRARGRVNRLLSKLRIEGAETLPAGTKLQAGDAEAGEITSAVFSPAENQVAALAYLRAPHAEPGAALTAAGRRALVA
jgi:aminomethyltransferase